MESVSYNSRADSVMTQKLLKQSKLHKEFWITTEKSTGLHLQHDSVEHSKTEGQRVSLAICPLGIHVSGLAATLATAAAAAEAQADNGHDDEEEDAHHYAHHEANHVVGPLQSRPQVRHRLWMELMARQMRFRLHAFCLRNFKWANSEHIQIFMSFKDGRIRRI